MDINIDNDNLKEYKSSLKAIEEIAVVGWTKENMVLLYAEEIWVFMMVINNKGLEPQPNILTNATNPTTKEFKTIRNVPSNRDGEFLSLLTHGGDN
jgi:hypothetical protein